jgi:hypothetical protein
MITSFLLMAVLFLRVTDGFWDAAGFDLDLRPHLLTSPTRTTGSRKNTLETTWLSLAQN